MPIFEYKCNKCGKYEEKLQKDKHIFICACAGEMKPIISRSNPHFKGKGFYQTDYKNK